MTIDRVLYVRKSGRMDFYSASYFSTIADLPFFHEKGMVFGYGKEGDEYVSINISRAWASLGLFDIGPIDDEGCWTPPEAVESYRTATPYIPPPRYQTSAAAVEHDTAYTDYWMSFYNGCTPKYVSPSTNIYSVCTLVDPAENKISKVEDYPEQIIPPGTGLMFDFTYYTINPETTLPICNGFACCPEIIEHRLVAPRIGKFYGDVTNRNRNTVLVDFDPVGGCSFKRMRACAISRTGEITIPSSEYNPKRQSLIVVLAGRIISPDQYYTLGTNITFKQRPFSPLSLVDEKICSGALLTGPTIISETLDVEKLIYDDNSFFVIVNRPNLQIVEHKMWWTTEEPIKPDPVQTLNTFANSHKMQFSRNAYGLLIDTVTQLVYDYAREEHTVTFYAENTEPVTWETATVTVRPEQPIVRLRLVNDNFMSARGTLFTTPTNIAKEDCVMWPNYVLYDFVFRG